VKKETEEIQARQVEMDLLDKMEEQDHKANEESPVRKEKKGRTDQLGLLETLDQPSKEQALWSSCTDLQVHLVLLDKMVRLDPKAT